jgi:membrane protease YdiL (CAAX protease family)
MSDGPQSPDLPQPATATAAPAGGPQLRPLSGWTTTGWALLALLAWLAAEAAVLVAFLLRWFALNPGAQLDLDKISHDGRLLALAAIFATTAQCGVVILAIRRTGWPVAAYLGLDRKPGAREVVFCLACVALMLVGSDLLSWLSGRELLPPFMTKVYESARDPGAIALVLVAVAVAAPLGEEIMFRGFLFRGWAASRLGAAGTIVLTSVIWAAIHTQYDWFGMAQIFCLGLLFGWVRWRSGSTALTMLMHAVTNVAATIETAVIIEWLS